ncbi:hypothetical protein [Novosphingobium sp. KN65.2]|uniref:hypothetical protein n=1 Tax=Novosphingobium sp. KN65.2 TaxID=1478134 RepID=UPI0005E16F48|nr:hypothetical protein [Novosphingobium sp. KN65.2]CDO37622.1 conserved hypothetical protein [Novosphingobium sp. KN65.2]
MPIKQATKPADEFDLLPGENPVSAPAGVGHNRPPLEELIPAEFREELLRDNPDFLRKFDELVDASNRARATDDDELKRCGNLVKSYRALIARINETHKIVKQPYLDGGRLVDSEKNSLISRVEAAKKKVEGIGDAYVAKKDAEERAERERLAAEQRAAAEAAAQAERARREAEEEAARAAREAASEEERQAAAERAAQAAREAEEAMAAAALAPAAPAKAEPVRSDEGATISGSKEWMSEVEDYPKAFKIVKGDAKVREAIDKAIAKLVKSTKGQMEMPGVRIWPVSKANFR